MRTLYLLDRNVISDIKISVDGKALPKEKRQRLNKIKSLDIETNLFSPLLSLIEGEKGRESTFDELYMCLKKEAEYISDFFENSHVDSEYLKGRASEFADTFSLYVEEDWYKCYELLEFSFPYLRQPMNAKDSEIYRDSIFAIADKIGLPKHHPVFVCCISASLGNVNAQKIIKPKAGLSQEKLERSFYNTMNDLMVIPLISIIRAIARQNKFPVKIQYLGFDKALNDFISHVLTSCFISNEGEVKINIGYQRDVFPSLNEDEYQNLMARAGFSS